MASPQVVKDWSLLTIYKGMFEFMALQCIAIAVVMFVPSIATYVPEALRAEQQSMQTEDVDDSANRPEEDPLTAGQEQQEEDQDTSPEKDQPSNPKK